MLQRIMTETEEAKIKKGPWSLEEDISLTSHISVHGKGRWEFLAKAGGLKRSGRSCRRRWVNYLCPNLKRIEFTTDEESLIIELHARWGNRWSRIAQSLPGRTDNSIKNYWRTRIQKKIHGWESGWSNANFQRPIGSSSLPNSFQEPSCLERIDEGSSATLPRQSTENGPVTYINDVMKENPDTWNGGKSGLEGVERHSTDFPYNFSVEYLNAMPLSELYGDGNVDCSLYNVASPMGLPHNGFYSDELWNMDEG